MYTDRVSKMSKQKKVEGYSAPENVLQRIREMESILDEATQKMDALEKKIAEYEDFQSEIRKLEAYYTSQQWKDDHAMDEEGGFPKELKRGVLSEDGIWNLLEQNRELTRGLKNVRGYVHSPVSVTALDHVRRQEMTEREKMEHQMMYDANYDKELEIARIRCKKLCRKYNSLPIENIEERHEFIKTILGESGENVHIEPDFWCDYGYRIKVGENFYANHGLVILDGGGVTFGDNVFIAPSCGFHTAGHPIDFERRNRGLEYAYSIVVGDNVWIGAGVQVMPGVTIGSNVVIGGGSIVTKDIPSDSVAVGNPCRVIRKITEDDRQRNWDRKNGKM